MSKQDNLHQLIHKLNPAEKRYFKVACQGGNSKPNNYILLFDAVEQMKEYDEPQLAKKFKGTNFINHLPSEKNYLYELVLKTMRSYNDSRTKTQELFNLLQDIQFLFEKGFYEVALKRVKKAKKIAYDFDRHGELLDLILWHKKLLKYISTPDLLQQTKELGEERIKVISAFQKENDIVTLYEQIFLLLKESNKKYSKGNKDKHHTLMNNPLLENSPDELSFKAKTFYYVSKAFLSSISGDLNKCCDYLREGCILWESRPDRISIDIDRYKTALHNYVNYSIESTDKSGVIESIQKLKTLPSNSSKEEALDFQRVYSIELYFFINEADFKNAALVVTSNENKLLKYEDLIDRSGLLALYFNIASMFFLMQDFKNCIKWLQRIKNLKTDVREDIQHFALILELITHYDNTPTVVESFYRSTMRHLTKYGKPNEFEQTLLKYLKKMISISSTDKDEVTRLLNKLKNDLAVWEGQQDKFIGMEELSCWIEAKLRRMPMSAILKEKVKLRKELA